MKDFVEANGKTQNEFCKISLHVNKILRGRKKNRNLNCSFDNLWE